MDVILDGNGSFCWVQGPYAAPVLSVDAERLTLNQPHSGGASSFPGAEFEEVPAESENLCSQPDSCAAGVPRLEIDPAVWASTQFATAQLGDRRRTARLVSLATQIAADPSSSLPKQTRDWSDLKGAYRLAARPEATFQVIASPHWQLTIKQAGTGRSLILDDTTEIDFGATRQAKDLGPVGSGVGRGFMIHSGLMVDPHDEWIVGLAGQVLFHRQPAPKGETRTQRRSRDRESIVWGQLIEQIGRPPEAAQWVHVMDRGADDFEVHCRAQRIGADWVGRVKSRHRRVCDQAGHECALSDVLAGLPVAGGYTLELRARPKQPARRAKVAVSFAQVTALVPRQPAASLKALDPKPISQWVVWAHELDPPAGLKEPIDWVLWTSLPVGTLAEAMEVIGYYEKRWLIEEWHKALKTGCQIERRQLQKSHGLEALAGVLSVEAVRLLQLKEVGRRYPERAAVELVPTHYVELVRQARRRGRPGEWTIRDFFRAVAGLGGFLGRKGDGEPGWITIWRGWEVLHWMLKGAQVASQPPPW
jgi:Transposase DNA-binding/Transposase Tn5 dimerisation domain/Transposase DDE domain